ncbi:MAG: cell division protein FtsQ/DivIB [Pseudomonadales bacterium]|nr:cell division protein FtsQ/DivIB [Pseudomonadales bacterium]
MMTRALSNKPTRKSSSATAADARNTRKVSKTNARAEDNKHRSRNKNNGASTKIQPVSLATRLRLGLKIARYVYRLLVVTLIGLITYTLYEYRGVINDVVNPAIGRVTVGGEMTNTDRHILQIHLSALNKKRFFDANIDELAVQINAMEWVNEVHIRKQWPNQISVVVEERIPVARWGISELVDHSGYVFSVGDTQNEFRHLPKLVSASQKDLLLIEKFREVEPQFEKMGLRVEQMSRTNIDSWSIQLAGGPTIILGSQHFDQRVGRFFTLWGNLPKGNRENMATMDFRYSNGVAVSKWEHPKEMYGVIR